MASCMSILVIYWQICDQSTVQDVLIWVMGDTTIKECHERFLKLHF